MKLKSIQKQKEKRSYSTRLQQHELEFIRNQKRLQNSSRKKLIIIQEAFEKQFGKEITTNLIKQVKESAGPKKQRTNQKIDEFLIQFINNNLDLPISIKMLKVELRNKAQEDSSVGRQILSQIRRRNKDFFVHPCKKAMKYFRKILPQYSLASNRNGNLQNNQSSHTSYQQQQAVSSSIDYSKPNSVIEANSGEYIHYYENYDQGNFNIFNEFTQQNSLDQEFEYQPKPNYQIACFLQDIIEEESSNMFRSG